MDYADQSPASGDEHPPLPARLPEQSTLSRRTRRRRSAPGKTQMLFLLLSCSALLALLLGVGLGPNLFQPPSGHEKWFFQPTDSITTSPVVSNGIVYVGSDDGNLYALDALSGRKKWSFPIGSSTVSWDTSPVVAHGIIYIGSDNLYALDTLSGSKKWSFPVAVNPHSYPVVVNGIVYITANSTSDDLYAFDAITGSKKWSVQTGDRDAIPIGSPVVANGILYTISSSITSDSIGKRLFAFDALSGQQKWSVHLDIPPYDIIAFHSSPVVVNGIVYLVSLEGKLLAFDALSGQQKWSFQTGFGIASSPTIVNGIVYIGAYDKNLYAFDALSGHKEWSFQTGDAIIDSPVVVNNVAYVGSEDGKLYALDAASGHEKWFFQTKEHYFIQTSPAVASSIVYVVSDSELYAIQPS